MTSAWNDPELIDLFSKRTPLVDVRAPVEFAEGSIPYSVNLPIMTNEERHLVGTCYKEHGQAKAIELGHELVSGGVKKARIDAWEKFLKENPQGQVFCFRGGLRSQIACQWITERGIPRKPISGGYKRLRNFFLSCLDDAPLPEAVRLGGLTGSGKTLVLAKVKNHIDLEKLANHRGSAFGPKGAQPAQVTFENLLACDLLRLTGKKITVEDESATIGKISIPRRLFTHLRAAKLVILEVPIEERTEIIFNEYVKNAPKEFFLTNLVRLEKKLGTTRIKALSEEIERAYDQSMEVKYHADWITTLLKDYYDPLYQKDLRLNQEKVIFRGPAADVLAYLNSL